MSKRRNNTTRQIKHILLTLTLFLSVSAFSQTHKPKIGLALSGGGAKGLAHIGVIKVLEENGIRPDFIAGTSMGSIVGAFYASGYNADQMIDISKKLDWDKLINDDLSRKILSINEKFDDERYILEFPIKKDNGKLKILLPGGLHYGYNIYNELSKLLFPVYNRKNFSNLNIPFVCVASDIEHGKPKVLKQGDLAKSLRASMAIPTVFTPVEINDTLLVDGGLLDNFPVMILKKMGADYIIGIDVQDTLYSKKELSSVINILDQSSKFLRAPNYEKARKNVDLYFKPEVQQYGVLDFDKVDSIIKIGENCAKQNINKIKQFIVEKNIKTNFDTTSRLPKIKQVEIDTIELSGLKRVPKSAVFGWLKIKKGDKLTADDLSKAITRLYGTLYFKQIFYNLEPLSNNKVALKITFEEKYSRSIRLGLNYNSELGVGLLLSYSAKNLIFNGDKYSTDIKIGSEPYFKNTVQIDKGWMPGIGFDFDIVTKRLSYYSFNEKPVFTLGMANLMARLYTQVNLFRIAHLGGGVEFEGVRLERETATIEDFDYKKKYLSLYAFLKADYLDKLYFPKSGLYFNGLIKIINQEQTNSWFFFKSEFKYVTPLFIDKLTLIPQAYTGTFVGDDLPIEYSFYTGGLNTQNFKGLFPFVGLQYNEILSESMAVLRADIRYNLFKNNYITFMANAGSFGKTYQDIIENKTNVLLQTGFGLKYSVKTIIGPVELAIYESDLHHKLGVYLNIGFVF